MSAINQPQSDNVVWHHSSIDRLARETLNTHKSGILWFTGLSGSGKSTLSHAVEKKLYEQAVRTYVLDGDNVRHGLCGDLGFSTEDRHENIRRIGETAKLFMDAGVIVLTAFISPFRSDRDFARSLVGDRDFVEIYCDCPLYVCEQRDVKGLYRRARAGEIKEYTGISSPYETPENPEIIVNTADESLEQCADQIILSLQSRGIIQPAEQSSS